MRLGVPVGALPDPGLALEPATVRLPHVLFARRKDVEHEPAAGEEQLARGSQRCQPGRIGFQVQKRSERGRDERDALGHRRIGEVSDTEVEELGDSRSLRPPPADLQHPL